MIAYTYITPLQAQILSKQLETGGKRASLMFGIQWDLVLKFMEVKEGKIRFRVHIKTQNLIFCQKSIKILDTDLK